ncbi:hypothetical protein ACFQT0_19625 [Hymenobacter humi]|uniref:Uncharacterized protein n=1 Tax=Hymenobacter humi TaxID=1411620 RepID=A0ABW2U8V1_9BACT
MAYAAHAGTKTQTRRIIKPQPIIDNDSGFVFDGKHRESYRNDLFHADWREKFIKDWCPYGQVGDRLWVRESLFWSEHEDGWCYQADNSQLMLEQLTARILLTPKPCIPSIHMPREASRTQLEIVSIRIERLHEISLKDAAREGMRFDYHSCRWYDYKNQHWGNDIYSDDPAEPPFTALHSFKTLWDHINGACAWGQNPWVWAVEFKKIEEEEASE